MDAESAKSSWITLYLAPEATFGGFTTTVYVTLDCTSTGLRLVWTPLLRHVCFPKFSKMSTYAPSALKKTSPCVCWNLYVFSHVLDDRGPLTDQECVIASSNA